MSVLDEWIEKYFVEKEMDLTAALDAEKAYGAAGFCCGGECLLESFSRGLMGKVAV